VFGSVGGGEILLLLVLALLLFGPRRLPEIGRTVGRAMAEFRKATQDFKTSLEREVQVETLADAGEDLKSVHRDVFRTIQQANPLSPPANAPATPTAPPAEHRAATASGGDSESAAADESNTARPDGSPSNDASHTESS